MISAAIRFARPNDIPPLAALRAQLWPEGTRDEHATELEHMFEAGADCMIVAETEQSLVGFLEARLRSHADGCETSPVGYLEGWFVVESARKKGIGRALLEAFEAWAKTKGCRELASDTWIDNTASHAAHLKLGFTEVDRIITFRKALDPTIHLGPHARAAIPANRF